MISPANVIQDLGGIARGSRLQQVGISRSILARAVRESAVVRIRDGIFALPSVQDDIRIAAEHGGALTCGSALRRHGVWVLDDSVATHVWVGHGGRAHPHDECACVSHFYRGAAPLGPVSVETALRHLYRCAGEEAFFAAFESAWNLRLLSAAARGRIRAFLARSARWLVDFARRDADSGLESILRLRLHRVGLVLTSQVVIVGVGRVDFVVGGKLILEVDGRENHDGESHRHKDLVRDAQASTLGYETLRFDYAQIIHDWPAVSRAIRGALTRLRDHA